VSIIIPVWGAYTKYLDECLEDVEKQTYNNIEIIVVDTETTLPRARNVGIEKAKGEYIVCLDVDDKLDPTYIEKCLEEDDDIVGTLWQEFGDSNTINDPQIIHPKHNDFLQFNRIVCSAMFKREIWEEIGGYDETMTDGLEDWDFWLRATKVPYFVTIIQEPLFFYRKHGKSMISDGEHRHDELKQYMLNKLK
jgi:glycosyltransferase involved in cell wall biosynthesis